MRLVYRADGIPVGLYLKSYDANYVLPNGEYDGGMLNTTPNIEEAQKFNDVIELMSKWKETAPTPWNIRLWDGQPNRPLTAFTIEVINLESIPDQLKVVIEKLEEKKHDNTN